VPQLLARFEQVPAELPVQVREGGGRRHAPHADAIGGDHPNGVVRLGCAETKGRRVRASTGANGGGGEGDGDADHVGLAFEGHLLKAVGGDNTDARGGRLTIGPRWLHVFVVIVIALLVIVIVRLTAATPVVRDIAGVASTLLLIVLIVRLPVVGQQRRQLAPAIAVRQPPRTADDAAVCVLR